MSRDTIQPVARTVPFDNSENDFESVEVQSAIEEVKSLASGNVSPGFSFGRSGKTNAGTYLQVDSVPSNLAGRVVPLTSGEISDIFIVCQDNSTFTIQIQKRVGNVFTTIHTENMTNQRKKSSSLTGILVSLEDEICCKIGTGSAQNVVVGLVIKGLT
jgi:hypothetical protein